MKNNFSVKRSFITLVMISATLGIANLIANMWLENTLERENIEANRLAKSSDISDQLNFEISQIQQFLTDVAATGDRDGFGDAASNFKEATENLDKLITILPEHKDQLETIKKDLIDFNTVGVQMAEVYLAKGREAGNALMKEPNTGFDARSEELSKVLEAFKQPLESQSKDLANAVDNDLSNLRWMTAGLILSVLIITSLIMLSIYRRLMSSLGSEPSELQSAAQKISNGDLNFTLSIRTEDRSSVNASMLEVQQAIRLLIADMSELSKAATNGKLDVRADATKHQGEYSQIVHGVNSTLDAVIGPLNVAADYVSRIAQGNMPQKITDHYNGDFNTIKNNLNTCIDAIAALIEDANSLSTAAANGTLEVRAVENRHSGDYRVIVEGMNATLSAVEKPINEIVSALKRIAEGDMSQRINTHYDGSYGVIKDNANLTMDRLTGIVGDIKNAVDSITTASKEIAAGNTDLSQRTEEQASSLEETASSMEELASTVKQNADNAKQANQLAATASAVAVTGGSVVGEVVTTMSAINEASRKIVDIISVIDGIAFQTNILALNAAVEAARAGEQGRGFAVVAGEVRNLAQRSAAAAKEIKQLISDSVEKVEGGTRQVEQAGKTMEEIVTAIKRVNDIMAEIAAASIEQSSGIDQVNQAVTQMDEVTQQNAALVEEAAAAAESLEEQANGLAQAVSIFKLDANPSRRVTASAPKLSSPVRASKSTTAKTAPKASKPNSDDEWEEF